MRVCCFCLIFLCLSLAAAGQRIGLLTPKVDKRVELLGIVARLAGLKEYNSRYNPSYVSDIHTHFDGFADHPAVRFVQQLRKTRSFGYGEVELVAVCLGQPPGLEPRAESLNLFLENKSAEKRGEIFADLLRQFYEDTDCETFFKSHEIKYAEAERFFQQSLQGFDVNWLPDYFGIPADARFRILLGPGIGFCNYAAVIPCAGDSTDVFVIIGTGTTDFSGDIIVPATAVETFVHEFAHYFIHNVLYSHHEALSEVESKIFNKVADDVKKTGYSSASEVLEESLVRAVTVRYFAYRGDSVRMNNHRQFNKDHYFLWIDELSDCLALYEQQRELYPSLHNFMPKITECLNRIAENDYSLPHVVSIDEFQNFDSEVDPDLRTITVRFDRPLNGKGQRIFRGPSGNFPQIKFGGYSDGNRALTIRVSLRSDVVYELKLSGAIFKTPEGYPIRDYLIRFKTK